jgi:hypothetical protein
VHADALGKLGQVDQLLRVGPAHVGSQVHP